MGKCSCKSRKRLLARYSWLKNGLSISFRYSSITTAGMFTASIVAVQAHNPVLFCNRNQSDIIFHPILGQGVEYSYNSVTASPAQRKLLSYPHAGNPPASGLIQKRNGSYLWKQICRCFQRASFLHVASIMCS